MQCSFLVFFVVITLIHGFPTGSNIKVIGVKEIATPGVVENPMENEHLFDGDMVNITVDAHRKSITTNIKRWPSGVIPFEIDPSLYYYKNLILSAMNYFNKKTNGC